jgi:hypothetical protein
MADPQRVVEARRLLAQLGVTVADLQPAETAGVETPTVSAYLPQVIAAAGPGARRTYGNYWARMATLWGDRRLDTIAVRRRADRRGRCVVTLRWRPRARHSIGRRDRPSDVFSTPAASVGVPRQRPATRTRENRRAARA